ncbi:KAP family P-loop NTPase fold protein [Mesorhizobium captivum]|uniref:KAP family P-loop NTPase fold protein n=1 Tax=Mesorhizobium captivum TaxID=3072319 RepID=UPI002A248F4F|nr:P-loop NTPase fold protein [Mesorhizobium sp. VK3C]MDX8449634.1 P-loop NTPase fold protein [Mesorhizobium sp. VK3C]
MSISSDLPIALPSEDRYGLDPFARALAASIANMPAPMGAVLALNGPWGAGKSSAINLIEHHLKSSIETGRIVLVPFNPWWFAGADALILAFFRELGKAIGPSLPSKLGKSINSLGQRVSALGAIAGAIADMKAPGLGAIVSGAAQLIGKATASGKTVEEEHRQVSKALASQAKRFLVIIDDIDRLNPDDVITMFRLIKSVGRLPNVIYLMAFDRQIAERIVAERFPSEGPTYLEKIIQGSFELPPPQLDHLRWHCAEVAMQIMGEPGDAKKTRFWNIFYDIVSPTLRTPRDVGRLGNQLASTWSAVAGNVDRADFLAVTALQLSEPTIYAAIRQNPDLLCGIEALGSHSQDGGEDYDTLFDLNARTERERRRLRAGLKRLFPRLDAAWNNTYHQGQDFDRDRMIASDRHFRSYFAFAISEGVVPAGQINELIDRADQTSFVTETFRAALKVKRATGETKAALLLHELFVHAPEIDAAKVAPLVAILFAIADELNVQSDQKRGINGSGDNQMRLHWLLNRVVQERFPIDEREAIYQAAMAEASLAWTVDFARRCYNHFAPRNDKHDRGEPIVGEAAAKGFVALALERLRGAAKDGSLIGNQELASLIFAWRRFAGDDGVNEVRAWTDSALSQPAFLLALADQMPSSSWSFGMEDRVQQQNIRVDTAAYKDLIDIPRLYARIEEEVAAAGLPSEDIQRLRAFTKIRRGGHDVDDDED